MFRLGEVNSMRSDCAKLRWKIARIGVFVGLVGALLWVMSPAACSQEQVKEADRYLRFDEKTGLKYQPDERGDRIPDFSYAGYRGGGVALSDAPIKVVVPVSKGDATERIQCAIDYVSQLPLDEHG